MIASIIHLIDDSFSMTEDIYTSWASFGVNILASFF